MKPEIIAIDGPAGSGKSSIGHALAEYLGYTMLDSGLVYRLIAHQILSANGTSVDASDDLIVAFAEETLQKLEVRPSDEGPELLFDKRPLSELNLHSDDISTFVPLVGRVGKARVLIRRIQQKFTESGHAILAGRDIGTVVVPHAELKLYLDVSLEERVARRQWAQNQHSATSRSMIEDALSERDQMDRDRPVSPLQVANDAVVLRTDKLSVEDTVANIVQMFDLKPISAVEGKAITDLSQQSARSDGRRSYIISTNPEVVTRNPESRRENTSAHYVVGGYVVDRDRVLLMWHAQLGRWVPCGGRIEITNGEYPHEAVIREIKAECGLDAAVTSIVNSAVGDHIASPLPMPVGMQEIRLKSGDYYLDMVYFCHVVGGELMLDYRQARAYHWFDVDDLNNYPLLPHVRHFASHALYCAALEASKAQQS